MGLFIARIIVLLLSLVMTESSLASTHSVVVLVPGFFNSLAAGYIKQNPEDGAVRVSPYFARTIVKTIEAHHNKVFVVENLLPVGTLESNGERVLNFLRSVRKAYPESKIHVIGHSAGGLYSIYAIDRQPSLQVASLTTIATPFEGVDLVDDFAKAAPILERISDLIDLRSLPELKSSRVLGFLRTKRLPDSLALRLYPAKQGLGGLLGWTRAKYLSWPMGLTARIAGTNSDGIVSVPSASAESTEMLSTSGKLIRLGLYSEEVLSLEHWEQVLDSRVFTLIGVTDTYKVNAKQVEFYSELAKKLK